MPLSKIFKNPKFVRILVPRTKSSDSIFEELQTKFAKTEFVDPAISKLAVIPEAIGEEEQQMTIVVQTFWNPEVIKIAMSEYNCWIKEVYERGPSYLNFVEQDHKNLFGDEPELQNENLIRVAQKVYVLMKRRR